MAAVAVRASGGLDARKRFRLENVAARVRELPAAGALPPNRTVIVSSRPSRSDRAASGMCCRVRGEQLEARRGALIALRRVLSCCASPPSSASRTARPFAPWARAPRGVTAASDRALRSWARPALARALRRRLNSDYVERAPEATPRPWRSCEYARADRVTVAVRECRRRASATTAWRRGLTPLPHASTGSVRRSAAAVSRTAVSGMKSCPPEGTW